ncbi:hypothetical protein AMTR_s00060p00189820 [Amborella trichopoda]|uniref:Uncharacterized protein n=1 Tax=Amborella trichopoda TaxID=13333 RepID=W1NL07_AMBTC|nr:hypothetical protein AMTR_s00060p00189820 [Amborella trichopoda]
MVHKLKVEVNVVVGSRPLRVTLAYLEKQQWIGGHKATRPHSHTAIGGLAPVITHRVALRPLVLTPTAIGGLAASDHSQGGHKATPLNHTSLQWLSHWSPHPFQYADGEAASALTRGDPKITPRPHTPPRPQNACRSSDYFLGRDHKTLVPRWVNYRNLDGTKAGAPLASPSNEENQPFSNPIHHTYALAFGLGASNTHSTSVQSPYSPFTEAIGPRKLSMGSETPFESIIKVRKGRYAVKISSAPKGSMMMKDKHKPNHLYKQTWELAVPTLWHNPSSPL